MKTLQVGPAATSSPVVRAASDTNRGSNEMEIVGEAENGQPIPVSGKFGVLARAQGGRTH